MSLALAVLFQSLLLLPFLPEISAMTIAQVPGVIICTKYWRDDLVGLYTGMAIGYAACCLLYGYIVVSRYVHWNEGEG